ncbi:MAG: hypothetical protein KKH28_08790 [Elusimicrobia bacterium]|nr:hypothetical protein [Elusimicrobiota bacterium]
MQTYNSWKPKIAKTALMTALVIAAGRFSFAQFSETTPLPQGLLVHNAVLWNNIVYVAGGVGDTFGGIRDRGGFQKEVYYCALNPDGTMATCRAANSLPYLLGLGLPASFAYNGRLYVLGGTGMFGARSEVYYSSINPDGSLAAWSQTTPMPLSLMAHAVALSGNRIYLLGGIVRRGGATDKVYYADILPNGAIGTWKESVSLPTTLFGHNAFVSGGKLFVIGGTTDSNLYVSGSPAPHVSDKVYAADLNADGTLGRWNVVSTLPNGISLHAAASTAKNIYILGGYDGLSVSDLVYSAPLLADGALGAWRRLAALPKGLVALAAAATENYLYSFGGGLTYIDKPQSSVYYLDIGPPQTTAIIGGVNRNGWNMSAVTVTLISTSKSGVAGVYYSLDGKPFAVYTSPFMVSAEGGHLLKYYAVDNAGNTEPEKSITFKIDLSAPAVSAAAAPAPDAAGWNNVPVSVVFTGTDAVSGIAYCLPAGSSEGKPEKIISVEGASQTVSGYCMDYADWSSTHTLTVNIDTTAPSILYTRTPLADEYEWNSGSVTIKFTCADALSGVRSCPADIILSGEGANISTSAEVFDYAGNSKAVSIGGINIDKTLPVSTAALSGTYKNGWYSSPVSLTLTSTDSLSGIEKTGYRVEGAGYSNDEKVYTGPLTFSTDGSYMIRYYSRDKAGNTEAEKTLSFSIDRTAPQAGYAISPPPNSAGWNNTGLRVVFNGTDALSGVEICATFIVSTESVNRQMAGWCRDTAGNTGYSTAVVNVDLSSPAVTAMQKPLPNADGWNNGPVTVMFIGIDAVSGAAYCTADKLITAEGAGQKVSGSCTDRAGNLTNAALSVNIDATAPGISYTQTPAPNAAGWNNTGVAVKFTCSDNLSGIKTCPADITLAAEGVNLSTSAKVYDLAGNAAQAVVSGININKTIPQIVISSPVAGIFVATKDRIGVFFAVKDDLDPAPKVTAALTQVEDRGSPSGARPAVIAVTDGQSIEPLDIDDGIWRLTVSATDFADNAAYLAGGTFEVIHDVLAPRTELTVTGNRLPVTSEGIAYATSNTVFTLTSIDDLVSVQDGIGLGVKGQRIGVRGEGLGLIKELTFNNPNPKQGEAFVSTFTFAPDWSLADGVYYLDYNAEDVLGNIEAVKRSTVALDNTAPETVPLVLGGAKYEANGEVYLNSAAGLALSAVDVSSNGVAAGLKESKYGFDGGAQLLYSSILPVSGLGEGRHALDYYSVDNLGNTEAAKTFAFITDFTPPVSAFVRVAGPAYLEYVSIAAVFGLTAADPGELASGPKEISYAINSGQVLTSPLKFSLAGADGGYTIAYRSRDNVDNLEVELSSAVFLDATAPLSALNVIGGRQYAGAAPGSFYASLDTEFGFTSEDPVAGGGAAGVKTTDYRVEGTGYSGEEQTYSAAFGLTEGIRTLSYYAKDNVNNTEVVRSTQIYVDDTAPVTSFNISEPLYIKDGVRYITPASELTFAAADPVMNEVSAGVNRIEVSVDGGAYVKYVTALKFAEGRHTIKYRVIDNVGNTEAERILEVQSDNTPPISNWSVAGGEWIARENKFYLNTLGSIALESSDPVVNAVASGVEGIYYGIDAGLADKYAAPVGLAEGIRSLNFRAIDNVGNAEVVKSTVIHVDGTKPVSALSVSGDQYKSARQYISPRTDIVITAADPLVNNVSAGVKTTGYRVEGIGYSNEENVYVSPFKLSAEGRRAVSFYSTDYVNNVETVKTAELWVDNTPPATELSISGARYSAPGDEKIYVTGNSGIVLAAADPVSNDTASGVMLTKYRIDGGNWVVYPGSFTIAAEGLHTVEYYSLDRVQNAEVMKTAKIAVDNTPPVTAIGLGEPKFEIFGLPILTPDTPVTLSAFDPVSGDVTSGLKQIMYEIKDVRSQPTEVRSYMEPFKLAQGAFIIRYWSKDNVNNAEIPKEIRVSVMTWREDGLIAVSGLEMSGTADISGTVKSNAVVSVSGNARILGDVTASTITVRGKAQITGRKVSGAAPVYPEPVYMADIVQRAAVINNNDRVDPKYLIDGELALNSRANILLSTGTYYFKGLKAAGGSSITVDGKVDILVEGGIKISGGSSVNAGGAASDLNIFVGTASAVDFTGGADFLACLYAPYSHMKLAGNAVLGGHYFAKTAAVSGTGNFVQSGETLPQVAIVTADSGGKKKATALGTELATLKVLSGPDPAFKLGEVYVFPNPAKGGAAPAFHMECGVADKVTIKIYTVSGRPAHEHTITGAPSAIDDGNGLSYAYEYAWRGHIPSGVYYYYIEAEKAGKSLKKTGKFAAVK